MLIPEIILHEIAENYDFENKYINYKSYKRGKNTPPLMVLKLIHD